MRQKGDVQVRQDASQFALRTTMAPEDKSAFIAQVTAVYSQRMTCDLQTADGQSLPNVPVMTQAGVIDGKPYGTVSLPAVEDFVVVMYAAYGSRHKVIMGTIFPYLANVFSKAPVNSSSKQFATKMLEPDKPLEDKMIFKSGTSVLVEEDGTIGVETPSGAYIRMDETNGEIKLEDPHGNIMVISASGVNITDANGNTFSMESGKVIITDANGNTFSMESGKVIINGNLEVLQ